jgi:predicted nucleic acid-binding protein
VRAKVAALVHDLRHDSDVNVLAQTDKGYSLTDCRSMIPLQAPGVSEVLTNDHHFTQEGFTILFPHVRFSQP